MLGGGLGFLTLIADLISPNIYSDKTVFSVFLRKRVIKRSIKTKLRLHKQEGNVFYHLTHGFQLKISSVRLRTYTLVEDACRI